MRWNCPHCGTNLAIADEKMNTSWSFSRCYQCAGYALVRRSEVNIIKVDRAPAGEKVILPESSETPILSEAATRNLNRLTDGVAVPATMAAATPENTKSIIKPATRRNSSPGFANPLTQVPYDAAPLPRDFSSNKIASDALISAGSNPIASENSREITAPIQKNLSPASDFAAKRPLAGPNAPAGATVDRTGIAYVNGANTLGFPEPLPDFPQGNKIRLLPMAIGIAAAFALGSGLYLLAESGTLFEKARASHTINRTPGFSPIDSVDRMAVSAHREMTVAEAEKHEDASQSTGQNRAAAIARQQVAQLAQQATAARNKAEPIIAKTNTATNTYSDQLQSHAMAPDRHQQLIQPAPTAPNPVQLSSDNPPLVVQPKVKNTHLRSGPGMVYPVVGNADNQARYVVTDWSDRWFKVLPQVPGSGGEDIAGWIRTDAVQIVSTETASN